MTQSGIKTAMSYAASGVNIDEGNAFVSAIKPLAKATQRPGTMESIGGFAGLFDLKAAGFTDPILVSGADGVGTKIKLAIDVDDLSTIGIDLVAMCVNDILANGAEPLFFLDYLATGALSTEQMIPLIKGITEGCLASGAALIGGETAEMPGLYKNKDFDLAGFALGAAERNKLLPQKTLMQSGDKLIALPSSGLHANGFSFVRNILSREQIDLNQPAPYAPDKRLSQSLLEPTRIYVKDLLPLIKSSLIKGLAHITGGGLTENIPRAIPDHLTALIDGSTLNVPGVFCWLRDQGNVETNEMLRTFNCGVGMVLVIDEAATDQVLDHLASLQPFVLGELSDRVSSTPLYYSALPSFDPVL